jgi:hypothetical protein
MARSPIASRGVPVGGLRRYGNPHIGLSRRFHPLWRGGLPPLVLSLRQPESMPGVLLNQFPGGGYTRPANLKPTSPLGFWLRTAPVSAIRVGAAQPSGRSKRFELDQF